MITIKIGNELKTFLKEKIDNKIEREYVKHFYNKIRNEKFAYIFYGLRRIGKTTICFQILNKFIKNKDFTVDEIGFIDIELEISLGSSNETIKKYIFEILKNSKIKILFFDEVQMLENWDMFVKSLNDHFPNTRIICSGSSSYKLKEKESGVGRFIKVNIQPLSLKEFIKIRSEDIRKLKSKREIINYYLHETPFFELWTIKDNDTRKKYLIDILEKSIIYDLNFVIGRSFTPSYMRQIIREIALSETGELNFDEFRSKFSIPKTTFYEYINIMQNIGIINILERFNGKLVLSKRGPNKYYLSFPFFYLLYVNLTDSFHIGKIYESLFLMYLNYQYNQDNLTRKIFYIKDKQGIDFYLPDERIAFELKTNKTSFNDLYLKISALNKINLKTINIDDVFDLLVDNK